jgi:predicted ester cyclase
MSLEDNKAIIRCLYDAFSTGDMNALGNVVATNAVDLMSLEGQAPGVEGSKERIISFRTSFPDLSFTIEAMIAEGD